jgi:hypothetical protein
VTGLGTQRLTQQAVLPAPAAATHLSTHPVVVLQQGSRIHQLLLATVILSNLL